MAANNWDVIILGAGPAGLALARSLCPNRRVLVIERRPGLSTVPRIGESLPGAASILLQQLGLFEQFLADPHRERGATQTIWDETSPVWRDALRDPAGPGWHLDRCAFDRLLHEGALSAGAAILEGCRHLDIRRQEQGWCLALRDKDEVHAAPILVDATGRSGKIARRLGVGIQADDSLLCVYMFLSSHPDDEDATMRIHADEQGWWYTVQIPHGQRVLAYHLDAKNPLWKQWQEPADFLHYARRDPFIADAIHLLEPTKLQYRPAGTAMLDVYSLQQAGSGFLAIGDALITFDPISSQGIFHSLASAQSAANAIRAGFPENPTALQNFQHEMHAVGVRYLAHLQKTYQGPRRFSHCEFWAARH